MQFSDTIQQYSYVCRRLNVSQRAINSRDCRADDVDNDNDDLWFIRNTI